MNSAVKMLYDEHEVILSAISVAKQSEALIGKDNAKYETSLRQLIYFFRRYADKYHHYKEEAILFPEMSKRNELMADGIIKEMLENHSDFRDSITEIEIAMNRQDFIQAQEILNRYIEDLLDHIAVENDEVFQAAETIFSDEELEQMYFRFVDCDKELGDVQKEELKSLVEALQ